MSFKVSALVMAGSVMLAACGGSGSNDTAAGGDAPQFGSEEFGLSDEELNARIEAAEGSIAECMSSLGFEYIPVDAATVRDAMNADKSLPGVRDEDFVAQYGFGVTTVFEDPVAQLGRCENARIYEGLSGPEQVAYEYNSTDDDLGVHGAFDDHGWSELCVFDPSGRPIVVVDPRHQLNDLTMAGIFFESREPPASEFSMADLATAFPEGATRSVASRSTERSSRAGPRSPTTSRHPRPSRLPRSPTIPK